MKLEWYRKNEPEKMQAAKDLLLREVRSSPSFMNVPYNHVKLLPYRTDTINTPARPEPRQDITWADDILGLGVNNLLAYRRSLTAEVDAYLLDSQVGTSILNFWQVRSRVFFVMSNLTSVAGKSASVSHNFRPCNGHSSDSRFGSTM
jgi:hypothetical protein